MKIIIEYEIIRTVTIDTDEAYYNPDFLNRKGKEYFATMVHDNLIENLPAGVDVDDSYYITGVSVE